MKKEEAIAYREAAIKDEWVLDKSKSENISTLLKEGFTMMVSLCAHPEYSHVTLWGPDRMNIKPPPTYDWEKIKEGINTCNECGAKGPIYRYSFAGRCCKDCLPKMRAQHERPGWCD